MTMTAADLTDFLLSVSMCNPVYSADVSVSRDSCSNFIYVIRVQPRTWISGTPVMCQPKIYPVIDSCLANEDTRRVLLVTISADIDWAVNTEIALYKKQVAREALRKKRKAAARRNAKMPRKRRE